MATPPDFVALQTLTAAQLNLAGSWVVKRDTIPAGTSTHIITAAFNADYTHYRMVIHGITVSAGAPSVLGQLRVSTTTANTTYFWGGTNSNYTNRTDENSGGTTSSWRLGYANTTNATMLDVMIYRPFDAAASSYYAFGANTNASSQIGGVHNTATSYDQFVLSLSAGTISGGTIIIFGLRD